jgi:hypothetical protein
MSVQLAPVLVQPLERLRELVLEQDLQPPP